MERAKIWRHLMNVNLGKTLDLFIAELIEGGLYQSQSEVVREGLRLLKEKEDIRKLRLQQLKSDIDDGLSQLNTGEFETHDPVSLKKVIEETKLKGRKILANKEAKVA